MRGRQAKNPGFYVALQPSTPSALLGGCEFPHHLIKIKARWLLADGELLERFEAISQPGLGTVADVNPVDHPVVVQE